MSPTIGIESDWAGVFDGMAKKRSKLVRCDGCGEVRMDLGGDHAPLSDGTTCIDRLTGKGEPLPIEFKLEPVKVPVHVFTKRKP